MASLKVAVLDDEYYSLQRLSGLLKEVLCDVIKESDDSQKFLEWLKEKPSVDAIFIDIQMPKISGLDILLEFCKNIPVIFVTGHAEHAIKAFELSAYDYILKPVTKERIAITVGKLLIKKQAGKAINNTQTKKIPVKDGSEKILFIPISDVTHFLLDNRRIYAYCKKHQYCTRYDSLSQIEEEFPNEYMRIHRDKLVRPESVSSFQTIKGLNKKFLIGIGDDIELEVSRNLTPSVKERLGV